MALRTTATRLAAIALASAAILPAAPSFARSADHAGVARTVKTAAGLVRGIAQRDGVQAYLGIPYAKPPVRELRWRAPQPVDAWQGVRNADRFSPLCVQPMRSSLANQYSGAEAISEDCLYLNVWTRPALRKAPVIVYIHGGAFYVGSGSVGIYGGEALAREGAVIVNLNYRVGPLGFLATPELRAESGDGASGNYGLLDQIAALRWVRDNIARFGGDPDNVTIVGQSAGSMSVLALQVSPLAKGLFHKAVGMSGAMIAGPIKLPSRSEAEDAGTRLMAAWKASNLAELRAMPADRLVVPRVPGGPSTGPAIDGHVLPDAIPALFAARRQSDVPLLLGFTRDEALGGMGPVTSLEDYRTKARERFGVQADRFLALYPASSDGQAQEQARMADRDETMVLGMFEWASLQAAHGTAPAYAYQFSRPHHYVAGVRFADLDPATAGAYHTSEVPFWLGTLDAFNRYRPTRAWTPQDRAMSHAMMQTLLAFARTGKPETSGVSWPRFAADRPRLVEFAETAAQQDWPDPHRLAFFKAFHATSSR